MKKNWCAFILVTLTLISTLQAQEIANLPGIVVLQNSRITSGALEYLDGVSVKALPGPVALSDRLGRFTLVFADQPPGKTVRLEAEKSGFEVVNKSDLHEATVLGRLSPLRVVMCRAGKLEENKMYYYNIGLSAVLTNYKQRLMRLRKAGREQEALYAELNETYQVKIKDRAQAMQLLEKERELAQEYIGEIAARFAEINLDDMDSLYLGAHRAFVKGNMTEVASLLHIDRISNDLNRIRENLQKAENLTQTGRERTEQARLQLNQNIQNALLAARAASIGFRFNLARKYYELAIRADTTQTDQIFEYCTFLLEIQKHAEVRTQLQTLTRRLQARMPDKNSNVCWDLAQAFTVMASNDMMLIDLKSAQQHNEQALFYFAQYEKVFGLSAEPYLAAQKMMQQIIQSFESSTTQPQDTKEQTLADTEDSYYLLISLIRASTREDYDRVLFLYEKLEKSLQDIGNSSLVIYLKAMFAETFYDKGNYTRAKQVTDQNLDIVKPLYKQAPREFAGLYGLVLNETAKINKANGQNDVLYLLLKADSVFSQEKEGGMTHDLFGIYYAKNAYEIGKVYFYERFNLAPAIAFFEKALHVRTQFGVESGKSGLDDYIENLNDLGSAYFSAGNYAAAISRFKRAIEKNKSLEKLDTVISWMNYYHAYSRLGRVYLNNPEKNLGQAREVLTKALEIYPLLSPGDSTYNLPVLYNIYTDLGICLSFEGRYAEASGYFQQSIALARRIHRAAPTIPNTGQLAFSLQWSGHNSLMASDPATALQLLEESDRLCQTLTEYNPDQYYYTKLKLLEALYALYVFESDEQYKTRAVQLAASIETGLAPYKGNNKAGMLAQLQNARTYYDSIPAEYLPGLQKINKILKAENQIKAEKDRLDLQRQLVATMEALYILSKNDAKIKYNLAGAKTYLSWLLLYQGQFDRANDLALEAYLMMPDQTWLQLNRAHALLFLGHFDQAGEIFLTIKDTYSPFSGERIKNIILRDFDLLEKEGITHPDIPKVKALLNENE